MDLVGIENEAEYFPSGTLQNALKEELQDITARWSGLEKEVHPVERLARVASPTLEALRQVRSANHSDRRRELARDAHRAVLEALGYRWKWEFVATGLEQYPIIPTALRVSDSSGRQALWVIESQMPSAEDEAVDPLGSTFQAEELPSGVTGAKLSGLSIEEVLGNCIFALSDGPRHVLVLGLSQLVLIDRRKWPARAVLRFDLQEIFSRAEIDTFKVMACLISREARVPEQGMSIADRLEEEAQQNANAVTTSLKRTVRDAIEVLGQEVLEVTEGKYKDVWIDGSMLSSECLRYMYRLLFLFYAEANPRLNVLDMKNPIYNSGYSLEALRDLESVPLRTTADRKGTFLWESLRRTLNLLYKGVDSADEKEGGGLHLPIVKVSLLDPESTPILNGTSLRNEAVQKVIRLLSLKSSQKGTSRISYAKLGIGQLGAVYETLISFTGVVAKTDLIELKPRKRRSASNADQGEDESTELVHEGEEEVQDVIGLDDIDLLEPSWFAPRNRIGEFDPATIVFDGPKARIYPKGTFIYRLAGRDREKTASFYTPEPLARFLVKQALLERCEGLSADEILKLKILEPAMGSAAFLVETTNQLADRYLECKQSETGQTIPQEKIVSEKQKVRAFIADRNCFGVDLNPIAIELGAISLWLNGLHASDFSPWFGDQLHTGNSLIGARRAAYSPTLLDAKLKKDLWLKAKPDEIGWRRKLPDGYVWQWLLPFEEMVNFHRDKSVAYFAKDAHDRIRVWRGDGFFKKLEPHEIRLVQELSRVAEALFDQVAEDLAKTRDATNDEITLWPNKLMPGNRRMSFFDKDRLNAHLVGVSHATNALPYKRLKTAMDAWCSLWVWPLDKMELLPSRSEFFQGMAMILEGGFAVDGSIGTPSIDEFSEPTSDLLDLLEPDAAARDLFKVAERQRQGMFRETNVEALIENFIWLKTSVEISTRENFVHFDLIFADVMKARGGFDIVVGNPPWAKHEWQERRVLADIDPIYEGLTASDAKRILPLALSQTLPVRHEGRMISAKEFFLQQLVSKRGAIEITSSEAMNPFVGSGSNNLYRCFIDLSFRLVAPMGNVALIHQNGHLTEAKSGEFRRHWYSRIVKYFEFRNQIKMKMFSEVHHNVRFSANVYRGTPSEPSFDTHSDIFLVSQVEDSYLHDGVGPVGGMKQEDGSWNIQGHKERIVRIDKRALNIIRDLSEDDDVPVDKTRFIHAYSVSMLDVFREISVFPKLYSAVGFITERNKSERGVRYADSENTSFWQVSSHWNETGSQKDGIIQNETTFRQADEIILQGPMLYVANPIYKTPRRVCETNNAYDVVDLVTVSEHYLPRTNYGPAICVDEYMRRMPRCRWNKSKSHADFFRVAFRKMVAISGERSFVNAVIPPGITHVDSLESIAFARDSDLLVAIPLFTSVPLDFFVKANSKQNLHAKDIRGFPWVDSGATAKHRALRLVCLTSAYSELWNSHANALDVLPWSCDDPRLRIEGSVEGPDTWSRTAGLRTEFARRMALVEIDVLVARAFNLTLEQLIEMYRIYFPIMQENEAGTWYDQNGRIVWTCSKGLPGIGWLDERGKSPGRTAWEEILSGEPAELTCTAIDDTMPGGPITVTRKFFGPFTKCDRIEDYKCAWAHFEQLESKGAT